MENPQDFSRLPMTPPAPRTPRRLNRSLVIGLALAGFVALAAAAYFFLTAFPKALSYEPSTPATTTQARLPSTAQAVPKVLPFSPEYEASLKGYEGYASYDVRPEAPPPVLFGKDKAGKETQLAFIRLYAKPASSPWVVYVVHHPDTDAGDGPYLAYNPTTHQLKVLRGLMAFVDTWNADPKRVSPDGAKYLSAHSILNKDASNLLYIVDIFGATSTVARALPTGRSFYDGTTGFGDMPVSHISWIDDGTIAAQVFDASVPEGTPRSMLETITVSRAKQPIH